MNTKRDMHPLSREVLDSFVDQSYFRSLRLANKLANKSPKHCLQWALELVEDTLNVSTPHAVAQRTLAAIREATTAATPDGLPELDELAWKCWCSGSFDEASPLAQRAVARLGWAAMLLIADRTNTRFTSDHSGIHNSANANGVVSELANQCGIAVDMVHTATNTGRMKVALSFSREMAT